MSLGCSSQQRVAGVDLGADTDVQQTVDSGSRDKSGLDAPVVSGQFGGISKVTIFLPLLQCS